MESCYPEKIFTLIPGYDKGAKKTARSIHNTVLKSETGRHVADILHGVWLKHPLHPALTDLVIGAWVFGSFLDGLALARRSKGIDKAADLLIAAGNAMALPTALAGIADYSTIPRKSAAAAATHGLMNATGLALNLASSFYRASGRRDAGRCLSAIASSALLVSAWIGGHLTYDQKVGVNRVPDAEIKGWKPALKDSELQDKPVRVEVEGVPVLLHRSGANVHALCAVCTHEGGPLQEGEFRDETVTCPWHQSVFDLTDGHVVHGPSTYPEPAYQTRVSGETLEINPVQSK